MHAQAFTSLLDSTTLGDLRLFPSAGRTGCNRCGGLMVQDRFYDTTESFIGVRCVQCGEVLDALIIHHRMLAHAGTRTRARSKRLRGEGYGPQTHGSLKPMRTKA